MTDVPSTTDADMAEIGERTEITLGAYHERLGTLLDDSESSLTESDLAALRAIVRERRNGRKVSVETESPNLAVSRRAEEIVLLLGTAARHLRPRETQQLDDLVAGREAESLPEAQNTPVRLHRHGWPRR